MCAFVYWCFDEAVKHLKMPNPTVRNAGGLGHTGLVEKVEGGLMTTIEKISMQAGSAKAAAPVAWRLSRKIKEINKGFIDYGGRWLCEEYAKRINV